MSAWEAAKHQVRVTVVNKGKIQRSGVTIMAPGAIAAVDDRWKHEGDSVSLHIEDTIRGGSYLNDQRLVRMLAGQSPGLVLELERMGAIFQRNASGTQYMLRIDGGHTYPRCPFLEDRTGKEMVKAMVSGLRKERVAMIEDVMVVRLIKTGGAVTGAAGICLKTLEPVLFECKALILATGGAGTMYENTDNSIDLTGDGFVLALDAGADIRDMEFVQFYPIGFLFPPALRGMLGGLLYYCRLLNSKGERFMEKYDPERLELSTRDRVSRAIMQEVQEGRGGPKGGVYMDLTMNEPGFIAKMTPALYATYRGIGIDPEKEPIEIAPTVHFFMGGMDVDPLWGSCVPGLYGSGELCGGVHGGNRLSQNALAEILVSGVNAGQNAALFAKSAVFCPGDPKTAEEEAEKARALLSTDKGVRPAELRARLKKTMWEKAGVSREDQSLRRALKEIEEYESLPVYIEEKGSYMNRGILEALENKNMLAAAKCVVLSALERRESRAAHYRSDYPFTDNENYLRNFLIRREDGALRVRSRKVDLIDIRPGAQTETKGGDDLSAGRVKP
jgi:succinate dehydrogenase/fumarate reductase flavoprotein subunit